VENENGGLLTALHQILIEISHFEAFLEGVGAKATSFHSAITSLPRSPIDIFNEDTKVALFKAEDQAGTNAAEVDLTGSIKTSLTL
jgi:hypothetical protein